MVAERSGNGLQNRFTPVQIRPTPLKSEMDGWWKRLLPKGQVIIQLVVPAMTEKKKIGFEILIRRGDKDKAMGGWRNRQTPGT